MEYVWAKRIVWADGSVHCNSYDGVDIFAEAYKLEDMGYIPNVDFRVETILADESVVYGFKEV